jgi:nucleotide-binding universal stress UspA family protein
MYRHILVPLENSPADDTVVNHVVQLARDSGARLTLIHVADGYVARNYEQLNLAPSEEMLEDREYLECRQRELTERGIITSAHLACGDPAAEILRFANEIECDLIAMATHGHGLFADLLLGSVTRSVRHRTKIPVLLIRSSRGKSSTKAAKRS